MGAVFTSASSQRLLNSTPPLPSTGYPFSVGVWVYPFSADVQGTIFALSDSGTTNHFLSLTQESGNSFGILAQAGSTLNTATVGNITANAWHFVLGRFVSSTSRRLTIWDAGSLLDHTSTATTRAPTSLDNISLGGRGSSTPTVFFNGIIGEFWYTDIDVQAQAANTSESLAMRLAYGGPFSVPHLRDNIIEYRSFRKCLGSDRDEMREVYSSTVRQVWANTNGVTLGIHPPLPYWYKRPTRPSSVVVQI